MGGGKRQKHVANPEIIVQTATGTAKDLEGTQKEVVNAGENKMAMNQVRTRQHHHGSGSATGITNVIVSSCDNAKDSTRELALRHTTIPRCGLKNLMHTTYTNRAGQAGGRETL